MSVAGQSSLTIGEIAKLVGDCHWIRRQLTLPGTRLLDRWQGIKDQDGLSTLHDLEETEEGFLFERLDGLLAMDAEDARSTGNSAVSALTLKDEVISSDRHPPIWRAPPGLGLSADREYRERSVQVLDPGPIVITLWSGDTLQWARTRPSKLASATRRTTTPRVSSRSGELD